MIVIQNDCVDCGLPCLYKACPYYEAAHYYCDKCDEEGNLYHFDGEQLCVSCILQQLRPVEYED